MYFKLLYSVSDFIINENEDLEFEITSPRKIIAQIKSPSNVAFKVSQARSTK